MKELLPHLLPPTSSTETVCRVLLNLHPASTSLTLTVNIPLRKPQLLDQQDKILRAPLGGLAV